MEDIDMAPQVHSIRLKQGYQSWKTQVWNGWRVTDFLGIIVGQKGFCQVLKHVFLPSQFTQSALDCMGVEVGRLRAFLQVRAHLGLPSWVSPSHTWP